MNKRIPLAWKNLTHDRKRLLTAIGGIVFAVLLMFSQTGFRYGLFDSTVALIRKIDGDIVIYSRAKYTLAAYERFPAHILQSAAAIDGVESVHPIYLQQPLANLRRIRVSDLEETSPGREHGYQGYPIRVISFDLQSGLLDGKGKLVRCQAVLDLLAQPDTALFDKKTKDIFELDSEKLSDQQAELADRRINLVGKFELGTDFASDGNLLMSRENLVKYFPFRNGSGHPLDVVDVGVVRLKDKKQAQVIRDKIAALLGGYQSVEVHTTDKYESKEEKFWASSTPIGLIFSIGTIMGFVVGVIMCYQVLATDINDHIAEFATLKAMGYSNRYFYRLITTESILLCVLGFIPGWLLSFGVFWLISDRTGLTMEFTPYRVLLVFGLTLLMCVFSGMIAVRKLVTADPANLF